MHESSLISGQAEEHRSLDPFETCARIVGRRQKGRILSHLLDGQTLFGELCKGMPDLSSKSLKNQLHELEDDGVIVKHKSSPQKLAAVEYSLTELGYSLRPLVKMMANWSFEYLRTRSIVKDVREEPDPRS